MGTTVVVLVEDDPMNRLLAVDALERAGFEVADFGTAADALAYMEQRPDTVAALLTDIDIPGDKDGLDLASTFVRRWPGKPVLVTSGLFGPEPPDDMPRDAGFMPKPWTARRLMARMQAALDPARPEADDPPQAATAG